MQTATNTATIQTTRAMGHAAASSPHTAPQWRIGAITAARAKAMQEEQAEQAKTEARVHLLSKRMAEDIGHFAAILHTLGVTDAAPTSRRYVDGEGDDAVAFEYKAKPGRDEAGYVQAYRWHDAATYAESYGIHTQEQLGDFLLGDTDKVYSWKNQLGSTEEGE